MAPLRQPTALLLLRLSALIFAGNVSIALAVDGSVLLQLSSRASFRSLPQSDGHKDEVVMDQVSSMLSENIEELQRLLQTQRREEFEASRNLVGETFGGAVRLDLGFASPRAVSSLQYSVPQASYVAGSLGQGLCPGGLTRVIDQNECSSAAASSLGKAFVGAACYEISSVGCMQNGGSIYYNLCAGALTSPNHAPICTAKTPEAVPDSSDLAGTLTEPAAIPLPVRASYVLGSLAQDLCPNGLERVTTQTECAGAAASALGKVFQAAACYEMSSVGCMDDGVAVYYSTCAGPTTASNHAPVCTAKPAEASYVVGSLGQGLCPMGSQRVTAQKECSVDAASAFGKGFGGAACYGMSSVGCMDNGAAIYYNTCVGTLTALNHAPVCTFKQPEAPPRSLYAVGASTDLGASRKSSPSPDTKPKAIYLAGSIAQDLCPNGLNRVTDLDECSGEAASALGRSFGGAACYEMSSIGCLDNGAAVFYNTCIGKKTSSYHAPVCTAEKAALVAHGDSDSEWNFSGRVSLIIGLIIWSIIGLVLICMSVIPLYFCYAGLHRICNPNIEDETDKELHEVWIRGARR